MKLRSWQAEAFPLWWDKQQGIIKVVTGGGKTFFAIHCIKEYIKADELIYQDIKDLKLSASIGNPQITHFEDSVFTGKYCTSGVTKQFLKNLESERTDDKR